jgi:signal transduction histidine kinase
MTVLIRDVLNYSRLSQMNAGFEPIDLNEVLQNVITDFELLIADKDATIRNDGLPKVKGIALQFHQLFSNLVSNALKFSETPPLIHVSASVASPEAIKALPGLNPQLSYTCIRFEDNGIGFEQQYAEQIFTIFQRLDNLQFGGTGIGLALCRKIVENHHGLITAEGHPGRGAVFYVYLPLESE